MDGGANNDHDEAKKKAAALEQHPSCEYWCSLVRFDRLESFLKLASTRSINNNSMVQSPFADLAFASYLKEGLVGDEMAQLTRWCGYQQQQHDNTDISDSPSSSPPWLYAHNHSVPHGVIAAARSLVDAAKISLNYTSEHASSRAFAPRLREKKLAKQMSSNGISKLFPEADAAGDCGIEQLSLHAANARRHIEVVLARTLWVKAHSKVDSADEVKADVMAQVALIHLKRAIQGEDLPTLRDLAPKEGAEAGGAPPDLVACPWTLAFHLYIMDVSKPMLRVLEDRGIPQAKLLAEAFEKHCAAARTALYEELEELRFEYICRNGVVEDRDRFEGGKAERAELNKPAGDFGWAA